MIVRVPHLTTNLSAISKADYEYLRSLPLILHLPSEHTFIVHAGLLPHDPTHSITDRRQPLSHLPSLSKTITDSSLLGIDWPANVRMRPTVPIYRQAQEVNLIQDIPQNMDPWVLLNMRSLRKDNKVTKYDCCSTYSAIRLITNLLCDVQV